MQEEGEKEKLLEVKEKEERSESGEDGALCFSNSLGDATLRSGECGFGQSSEKRKLEETRWEGEVVRSGWDGKEGKGKFREKRRKNRSYMPRPSKAVRCTLLNGCAMGVEKKVQSHVVEGACSTSKVVFLEDRDAGCDGRGFES